MPHSDLPLLILSLLAGSVGAFVGGMAGKVGAEAGIFGTTAAGYGSALGFLVVAGASFAFFAVVGTRKPPPTLPPSRPQVVGGACFVCGKKLLWINEGRHCEKCQGTYCVGCAASDGCPRCAAGATVP
jgi:hypothetical protein